MPKKESNPYRMMCVYAGPQQMEEASRRLNKLAEEWDKQHRDKPEKPSDPQEPEKAPRRGYPSNFEDSGPIRQTLPEPAPFCSSCGTKFAQETAKFCTECGAARIRFRTCPSCGAKMTIRPGFCPYCGEKQGN